MRQKIYIRYLFQIRVYVLVLPCIPLLFSLGVGSVRARDSTATAVSVNDGIAYH